MELHYSIDVPFTYVRNGYEESDTRTIDEFEYEVDICFDDVLDYIKYKDDNVNDDFKKGAKSMFDNFSDEIIEALEKDDDFVDFMKERYEDEAMDFYRDMR